MPRPQSATTIYYLIGGMSSLGFALIFTVNLLYQAQVVGLNPLQLVLVGTTLEFVAFLFEIPTGVVADSFSRRLSVIIGMGMVGVGFLIEGAFPFLGAILLNQVIWGIGVTFTSGALEAWIADEVGVENLGAVLVRGGQVERVVSIFGVIASGVLGSIALALPILIGAAVFLVLTILMIALMPENNFQPASQAERVTFATMARTTRDALAAVRVRPILAIFLITAVVMGAYSEGFDRLWREHLTENIAFPVIGGLQPVVWFTGIVLVTQVMSIFATEIAQRRVDANNQRQVSRFVMGSYAVMVVALFAFSGALNLGVAVIAYLVAQTLRTISAPFVANWQNQHIDSHVRATVISSLHQFDALGQLGGGPFVGFVGLRLGLRAALATAALLLAPTVWLVGQASRLSSEATRPAPSDDANLLK